MLHVQSPGDGARWRALAWLVVAVMSACASRPRAGGTLARLDVIAGQTLVIPLDASWSAWLHGEVTATFDQGKPARGEVRRVEVRMDLSGAGASEGRAGWLPEPGVWRSVPRARSGTGAEEGVRVIVVRMPAASTARLMRVGDRTFSLNWLGDPRELLARGGPDAGGCWSAAQSPAGAVSPVLSSLAWPEAQTPLGRWRYRMMLGSLGAVGTGGGGGDLQAFEDPTIEALATQNEQRWRTALARLWLADPDLCERLKKRLTAAVDFGRGVVAPAWPSDHAELDGLLRQILDPERTPAQVGARVEDWLTAQPRAMGWVMDDAGILDGRTGRGVARIGVANLTATPTLCWAGSAGSPELRPLEALAVQHLEADGPGDRVRVHAGRWEGEVAPLRDRQRVRPPGLHVGPLHPDLTMARWMTGDEEGTEPAGWGTGLILLRSPVDGAWEVYVECRAPADSARAEDDEVRLWLGASGTPRSVLRINGAGAVADEARRADLVATPADARVLRGPDRWSFHLRIPSECVEPDGVIRLGVTRHDPHGRRSAWPRAMLPWQAEPGRVALDTGAWGGAGEEAGAR